MHRQLLSFRIIGLALVIVSGASHLVAQDARASLQTVLGRLVPNRQLPVDLTLIGQVTDPAGVVRPFRVMIKGKDRVRYEIGSGTNLVTTIQSRGAGWTETGGKVKQLEPPSAIRRPGIVPFLDLLAEADAANLQITDRGSFSIGNFVTRRFSLKLPDPEPNIRLFRKALDEEVEIYVDAQTSLVVRSESWVTAENNPVARVQNILEFSDYRIVGGLTIPFQIRSTTATPGQRPPQWTYTVLEASVNSGVSDSIFVAQERAQ